MFPDTLMSSHLCHQSPPQLARFPEEIREAYRRFRSENDLACAQKVVLAALVDILPEESLHDRQLPLQAEQRLIEDLGYDSLAIAEIVFFLEDLFGVVIKTADLKTVRTVGDLRQYVERSLAATSDRE